MGRSLAGPVLPLILTVWLAETQVVIEVCTNELFEMSKMKRNIQIAGWFILAMMLSSCVQMATTETRTAQPSTPTPLTPTPRAYSITVTPTFLAPFVPIATKPNEQVYIDPEGWYSVNIPAEWKSTDSPNSFSGESGFFETGYLPEMMFMQHPLDVCQWLANIDSKSTYSVSWRSEHDGCELTSLPEITPATVQEIIKNPVADYPQRFFYIKTDAEHYSEITSTFVWLQPINERTEPAFHLMPLRPEDASFWENTAPMPIGFSVEEYELPQEAQNESPSEKIFLEFIPSDAPQEERKPGTVWFPDTWEDINEKIKSFGYELRPTSQDYLRQLYKNGVLLVDNIYNMPEIYHFSTTKGERIAFIVYSLKDTNLSPYTVNNTAGFLVQNDTITKWEDGPENPMDPGLSPVLYKDELLWVRAAVYTQVQVQNSHRDVLFSFATYFGTRLPVNGFKAWNNHWILEVSDFVIQDGEILNEKFGFEEVFDWRLINDKPFYFFRKGQRVGISYDGQFLPLYYHDVAHGFCCGLALNNPVGNENTVRFFGKRDGIWYYVIVEVN